jgi:DNA-binding beta-propeller fold protein YncE
MSAHKYKIVLLAAMLLAWTAAWLPSSSSGERGGSLGVRTNDPRKQFVLEAEAFWRVTPPVRERFDASALGWRNGQLLTVNDRGPELYEIVLKGENEADLRATQLFPSPQVTEASARRNRRHDVEGIAVDDAGWIYISEESQRAIYRTLPGGRIEALPIDWSGARKYFLGGVNASFEGIAIGGGKLYVANERESPRILVVDLASNKLEDDFFVDSRGFALGGPHYSDLAFYGGSLFVLNRNHRCILEVDPATKKVTAEYSFGGMEIAEEHAYVTQFPTGTIEGLAVDERHFWLITDNNGLGRYKDRTDIRPTLFRCARPGK